MNTKPQQTDIMSFVCSDDAQALVDFARDNGYKLKSLGLSTSQIRNVFARARQIEAIRRREDFVKLRTQLQLLKPRLAYLVAKENKDGVRHLRDVLEKAIDCVFEGDPDDPELTKRFDRFMELFEALLAYHREAGGR